MMNFCSVLINEKLHIEKASSLTQKDTTKTIHKKETLVGD
jgi:hypothetical protein